MELPADPLRVLVPAPDEAPAGTVPLLASSGPRDANGFSRAYAAQYAPPADDQVLSGRRALHRRCGGELLTLRFRTGATTWLLAYGGSPTPEPAVQVALAQRLVAREAEA